MGKHQQSLDELHIYLQNSIPLKYKPSSELLNLRKIQAALAKQKNYTEADKVLKDIKKMERHEDRKYLDQRAVKIRVQMQHMIEKNKNEMEVLVKKINTIQKEQDKERVRQQQIILQRCLNQKNELILQQRLEKSKLSHTLTTKNYASTIVGKLDGALKSMTAI